ncbi:MAG: hypothetical protein Q8L84_12940, partial [Hyphomonas sp.]|nr:hypothetical protein [Hyphomonas sp.]
GILKGIISFISLEESYDQAVYEQIFLKIGNIFLLLSEAIKDEDQEIVKQICSVLSKFGTKGIELFLKQF